MNTDWRAWLGYTTELYCFTVAFDYAQMIHKLGRIPLDERSAHRMDLYLRTHITQKRQISMPQTGMEPEIPGTQRTQMYASNRAAAGVGPVWEMAGLKLGSKACKPDWCFVSILYRPKHSGPSTCLLFHPCTLLASGFEGVHTLKALEEKVAEKDVRR